MQPKQKANILLVDDRAENLLALEAILDDLGQNLVKAHSGREALKSLLQEEFAVILLDAQMPEMDGFETAAQIRAREKTKHTPIVFITALYTSDIYMFKGYSLGAVDYIVKPVEPRVLKAKVRVFIDLFQKTQEAERQAESLRQITRELDQKNKTLVSLFAEVKKLNEELEQRVIERTGELEAANQELKNEIAERKLAEEAVREQREWLRVTLSGIGDAVIATDVKGRVTFMNPVSESLTGWKQEEAAGKPLEGVFNIINEDTGETVESPVNKVLREGVVTGLANHTVLIAKDGTETPIDDSGAPIQDDRGNILGVVLVFHDIRERRRAEMALRESEAKFRTVAETAACAMFIYQGDNFRYVNPATEAITGYTRDELLAMNFWDVVHPDFRELVRQRGLARQRGEPVPSHYESKILTKNGEARWVEFTAGVISFEGKPAAVGTAYDITERKRAEEERVQLLTREQEARKEAEAANRAKDEFLAVVSHELRTPLTSILGWARMLHSGTLDEATFARGLETVERNARAQAQLIEDLLDVSRIITGKLRLDVRAVELVTVIRAAIDSVRPAADVKGIELKSTLDPEANPVWGDPDRLQQVVWNLLSNAVKFTPKGGRVEIQLERVDSYVEIRVSDTGQGISADFLPYIFDHFRQADSTISRKHGGLGLGLAIVRHLVELHGGTAHAESRGEGQGATFTVRLPIASVRTEAIKPKHKDMPVGERKPFECSTRLDGLRALVVDDEPDTRELLTLMLEQCGVEVKTASSAAQALEALEQSKPDVLVSDIGMPVENGYDLIRKVRALDPERGGRIPAIALTAYAKVEDRMRVLSAGYQMHVPKPVEPAELVTVIASLVGRTGRS